MGRYVFKLPDVGEGTAEAEIVAWHVKVGDAVGEDQNLVDVMTDKATVEMTSPVSGKVLQVHGEPGQMAAVGSPLVELEVEGEGNVKAGAATPAEIRSQKSEIRKEEGEGLSRQSDEGAKPDEGAANVVPLSKSPPHPNPLPLKGEREKVSSTSSPSLSRIAAVAAQAPRKFGDKPIASPAVRERAHELGVELQYVAGSGPAGRITHHDLDNYIESGGRSAVATRASGYAQRDGVEEIKVIGLRRKIAEKMQDAKRRIPHFAYVEEIDMTELESLRAHLNATKRADQPKLNVLPFLMRALVRVLPDYPQVNARFDDDAGVVHRYAAVHIGIATQTANGLIVPVVKHAEARDVWDSAFEVARVAALARENKASKDDLTGSTITITSLGTLGGVVTTPVINHPEVAIIGPNAIIERPVVRNGQVVVRKMMNLSSSFDHRVVDGYDAAEFIQRIKALLEHPATLFMD
ncbi:MAG TPA: dihydrolipoamide acetyltransferase family protein [Rhizomicrobium sp.]|jgi:2-oxoisovalerate dehydrogenase E2 component (dihydrolipoyl transacylase)|nr:dihydrolipoamide acetyltransferase family protein [Rhizomicrobium sp.]